MSGMGTTIEAYGRIGVPDTAARHANCRAAYQVEKRLIFVWAPTSLIRETDSI